MTSCTANSSDGFACTEPAGHTGDHVAHGIDGTIFATWPNDEETTTMSTTIPTATATATPVGPTVVDDTPAAAAADLDMKALEKDPRVILRGNRGVDAWALYYEELSGSRLRRVIVFRDRVIAQLKNVGDRNARWRTTKATIEQVVSVGDVKPRGAAIVVQLVDSDVESLKANQVPLMRYTAIQAYEDLYGKVEE